MSYINPSAPGIDTIGIDAAITSLQTAMSELSWLPKCFHRAYMHREVSASKKTLIIPKTWEVNNEWYNCLPNDNLTAQAFFFPVSEERVSDFNPHETALLECDIALIVWVNTNKLIGHSTGPSLAYEKFDVLNVLKDSDSVISIKEITDRSATEIFAPFTIEDQNTHYTMLPFAGFRIEFTIKFDYTNCNIASS